MAELWLLFITFLKIGAFTFGGGYAMIPLITNAVMQAVTAHFRGQLPDAFPEGMIVFFINSGQFFPAFNPDVYKRQR